MRLCIDVIRRRDIEGEILIHKVPWAETSCRVFADRLRVKIVELRQRWEIHVRVVEIRGCHGLSLVKSRRYHQGLSVESHVAIIILDHVC